jgi:hypothetical protein
MPNTWAGLYNNHKRLPCTFNIPHKGFVFHGVHSLEFEDEYKPVVVTIEALYIDDSDKDVLDVINPTIVHFLEEELARN